MMSEKPPPIPPRRVSRQGLLDDSASSAATISRASPASMSRRTTLRASHVGRNSSVTSECSVATAVKVRCGATCPANRLILRRHGLNLPWPCRAAATHSVAESAEVAQESDLRRGRFRGSLGRGLLRSEALRALLAERAESATAHQHACTIRLVLRDHSLA